MKKRILAAIMAMLMMLTVLPAGVFAAEGEEPDSGVHFTKTVLPATADAPARIMLEAYTTGSVSSTQSHVPTDIILVLDQSGSMDDTLSGGTKLSLMRNAVTEFVAEVAQMNNSAAGDLYRVAIVGFASESGYSDNTEILTATRTEMITQSTYDRVTGTLDRSKTYYIRDGVAYQAITYREVWGNTDWYTTGSYFPDRIDVSAEAVFTRTDTLVEGGTYYGVPYNSLTAAHYAGALVNCTAASIATTGELGQAIAAIDGNGATRTDLGLEMAEQIFNAQDYISAANQNRQKVVVLITDGVPTTQSNFSETVANGAVTHAKGMKDAGAHIFAMYLGTPSSQSVNFLQAVSSNYPGATSISALGTKAAESYYSAHTDSSAVQGVFSGIANAISANSTLNEGSIVTDQLSPTFMLAADLSTTGVEQIKVFTVDKTASGWSSEQKAFANANVTLSGADNKRISVSGFNFAAHCVTDTPKEGTGGSDYGRKLVIYIPIVADPTADTFGGYLPTNAGAAIYQDASATEPTVSVSTGYCELPINYHLHGTARAYHIHESTAYTVNYTPEFLNPILDEMLAKLPDGVRNAGVNMTYHLYDVGLVNSDGSNPTRDDDIKIASVTVPAGQALDVSDFANWTFADANHTSDTITVTSDNFAEKVYALVCVLTSTNPTTPASTMVYSLLDIAVTNEDATHIVYGTIDDGGLLSVLHKSGDANAAITGSLFDNTYTEAVKEGKNSDIMTFAPKAGYEILSIKQRVLSEQHLQTVLDIYNINDPTTAGVLDADGKYTFQAVDITGGLEVIVETRLKTFTLDTTADVGSEIIADMTYPYSTETMNVPFSAIPGYFLPTLTVDGIDYNLTDPAGRVALETAHNAVLTTATDAAGNTIVTAGYVVLSRTDNHTVSVPSAVRPYSVTLKYYVKNADGSYTEQPAMTEGPTAIPFGTKVSNTEAPAFWPAQETLIGGNTYTLSDWYLNYSGTEFNGVVNLGAVTMPAYDLVLHAVWTKNPDVQVANLPIQKKVEGTYGKDSAFKFVAIFHEHKVGETDITIPAGSSAPINSALSIVLTDAQANSFMTGNGDIYIYELVGDDREGWLYDNSRYTLRYENGAAALYLNGQKVTDGIAVFTNIVRSHTVTVNYYIEDTETKLQQSYTVTQNHGAAYDVTAQIPASLTSATDHYVLVDVNGTVSGSLTAPAVINVYYALDNLDDEDDKLNGGDDIPDKYQAVVTYAIENGTWDGTSADSKIAVFTLYTKDAATGAWTKLNPAPTLGTSVPDVSTAVPNAGFSNTAIWSPIPYAVDVPVHGAVYTYVFQPLGAALTLTFDANGGAWTAAVPEYTMGADNKTAAKGEYHFGDVIVPVPADPTRDGYTFIGWSTQGGAKYWGVPGIVQNIYENVTLYAEWQANAPVPPAEKLEGELWINIQDESGAALADLIKIDVTESYLISATENADADYIIPAKITGYDGLNYIYEGVVSGELSYTLTRKGEVVVVCLGYTPDELDDDDDKTNGGDDIPDKYQAVVTYAIENGTWDGTSADSKIAVFTLYTKDAATGAWNKLNPAPTLGTSVPDVSTAVPNAGFSNTAIWSPIPYAVDVPVHGAVYTYVFQPLGAALTLTFDANGGAWTAAVSEYTMGADNKTAAKGEYHFGDVITAIPANPTRDGYTFIGWSTQGGAKYWGAPGIVQNIYENVTLYAEWQANAPVPPAEKLEGELWINIQDESGAALADLIKIDVTESYLISATENADADYVIPAKITGYDGLNYIYEGVVSGELSYTLTRKGEVVVVCLGYTLDELDDDDDKTNGGDNIPDKYQAIVTYRIVGGVWNDGTSADMQYVFTLKEKNPSTGEWTVLSPAPVLGATIPTAKTSTAHTGEWDKVFDANTAVTASITYTYLMTALPGYTVSYDLRGGFGAAGVDYSTVTVVTGTVITVKPAPNKEGATFGGYAYNGKLYNPGESITVTENVVLTAQWNTVIPPIIVVPGSITLFKVDADDPTILIPNVSFSLYRANGTLIGNYTTNAQGRINVVGLSSGSYYWVETKAAEGYLLDSTAHPFTITMGQNLQMTVTNKHSKVPGVFSGEHYAYIVGYTDGLVHPEGNITRAEVATIFFRLLDNATREKYITKYSNFVDVYDGLWYNVAVSTMAAMGIVNGYPDGTFRPNEKITRAEFAAIAARFDTHGNSTGVSFDDIYEHWAMKEINIAANNGWVLGYEDGTFRPDQPITRAESMALVNRVLQRIPETESDLLPDMIKWPDNMDKSKWYYLTVQEATNSHDYARRASGYEYWTGLKENPDWTVWEK